jgi:hypothetical protein
MTPFSASGGDRSGASGLNQEDLIEAIQPIDQIL